MDFCNIIIWRPHEFFGHTGTKAEEITKLSVCLTTEIMARTEIKHFDVDVRSAIKLCRGYIEKEKYHVIAAHAGDEIVGFAALCESYSIYAEGSFGIIQEFYVIPDKRSKNVGCQLIKRAVSFTKVKGWKRLELCTPPVPEFDRTVAFYESNGFVITGGYKMKRTID